jgi:hypothetical protein
MAAGDGATASPDLDVAIYGTDGTLLRDGTGGRYRAEQVRFSTGLPGGFQQASFTLSGGTGRAWPGRAGHKVIIRQGRRVLWWGWIEDIRRQGPAGDLLSVACLGPWQVASQRLLDPTFVPSTTANTAIQDVLRAYMPEMSNSSDELDATGVALAAITWNYEAAAQLIKRICDTGNTSNQQMLFAFWEPGAGTVELQTAGDFETWGVDAPQWWTFATVSGTPVVLSNSVYVHSGAASVYCYGTGGGTNKGQLYQDNIAVAASTSYTCDYWVYWAGALGGLPTCQIKISWYTGARVLIETSSATLHTRPGSDGWQQCTDALTSPAGAMTAKVTFEFAAPSYLMASLYLDQFTLTLTGGGASATTRPQAYLWARDLSTFDYTLSPAALADGLVVETTTRSVVNRVIATYGAADVTEATDGTSQGLYRERDSVLALGADEVLTGATAAAARYLADYKDPLAEPQGWRLSRPGAVRSRYGRPIDPLWLRAGDRLKIVDGALAGTIVMLTQTEWSDGAMTCTPERPEDVVKILARV